MKKFYTLLPILLVFVFLSGQGFAQTYTAVRSGSWHTTSGPNIWDPNGEPSTICNNCTITISPGLTVALNTHVELQGQSVLTIGSSAMNKTTTLTIGSSNAIPSTDLLGGYNIVMDTLPGNSIIVFPTKKTAIDATNAGTYDGIFSGPLPNPLYNNVFQKQIGNKPSLFAGNIAIGTSPANYGPFLSGPAVLFSGGTLPIVLSAFNASLNNNVVNLSWTTSSELNFSHFEVLRSGDGSTWATIGTVVGKNAANGASYSFTDPTPLHGTNNYRLKSVDLDGKSTLSEIKQVQGSSTLGFRYGPNPASDHVGVTFGSNISSNVTLKLINLNGQVLQQKKLSNVAGTTYTLSLSGYPSGIYNVQVKTDDGTESSNFRVLVSH